MSPNVEKSPFGCLKETNEPITLYTLTNASKRLSLKVTDYGATIVQVIYPDRQNIKRDLVLGFDSLDEYRSSRCYFGATIGRVANRIGSSCFLLNNGQRYQLFANNGSNSLHGGQIGFDKRKWNLASEISESSIKFQYTSIDGEEGYPGTLDVTVQFTCQDDDSLKIEYEAKLRNENEKELSTIVSLTNHSYFNLNPGLSPTILDHKIRLFADRYLESDPMTVIPTGKILPVKGTAFELNQQTAKTIGENNFPYDHCMVLDSDSELEKRTNDQGEPIVPKLAAQAYSPSSGIRMSMLTTEPSFQFYIGGFIPEGLKPKQTQSQKQTIGPNSGFCLEAQRFPNAVNVPDWQRQVLLKPSGIYRQITIYKFDVLNDDQQF